jgi:hypothetical protein
LVGARSVETARLHGQTISSDPCRIDRHPVSLPIRRFRVAVPYRVRMSTYTRANDRRWRPGVAGVDR